LLIATAPAVFTLESGLASWYGGKFQGRLTSSGEVFDTNQMTAAHKHLPFGTLVKVVNLDNNKSTVVRVNDRGPFVDGRVIDLSRAAAERIDMVGTGVARVSLEVLAFPPGSYAIQVGAFSVEANAERARARLEDAGYIASLDNAVLGVTRVMVRGVSERDLDRTRQALGALGFDRQLVRLEQPAEPATTVD
jgi:rare lipoprotein A